uniref:Uncharacterized protein n=1 Tax=Heterorhabditis bacteriophora TaxID=37862 RepID=A0A1I7X234_HETBA
MTYLQSMIEVLIYMSVLRIGDLSLSGISQIYVLLKGNDISVVNRPFESLFNLFIQRSRRWNSLGWVAWRKICWIIPFGTIANVSLCFEYNLDYDFFFQRFNSPITKLFYSYGKYTIYYNRYDMKFYDQEICITTAVTPLLLLF